MYKLDLHTHSEASPDGSLDVADYQQMLASGGLDYIAITDHNTIHFAVHAKHQLGDHIIIGEEIMTAQGEIIGLFLKCSVPAGLSIEKTVEVIRDQGGLVYVPHPFEAVRHGLSPESLHTILKKIDIIEVINGRAIVQKKALETKKWAAAQAVVMAASSDAHGPHGWGRTYTLVQSAPTAQNLKHILKDADLFSQFIGVRGMLYPKLNRVRKKRHYSDVE